MVFRQVGIEIDRPAPEVAAFVRDPRNLPQWAAGLATGIQQVGGQWFCDSPMGRVQVEFCADNPWGVCDHEVTLPDGAVITNPMRVIPDGARCQVVFTVRGEDVERDAALVEADLQSLRSLLNPPADEIGASAARGDLRAAEAWRRTR